MAAATKESSGEYAGWLAEWTIDAEPVTNAVTAAFENRIPPELIALTIEYLETDYYINARRWSLFGKIAPEDSLSNIPRAIAREIERTFQDDSIFFPGKKGRETLRLALIPKALDEESLTLPQLATLTYQSRPQKAWRTAFDAATFATFEDYIHARRPIHDRSYLVLLTITVLPGTLGQRFSLQTALLQDNRRATGWEMLSLFDTSVSLLTTYATTGMLMYHSSQHDAAPIFTRCRDVDNNSGHMIVGTAATSLNTMSVHIVCTTGAHAHEIEHTGLGAMKVYDVGAAAASASSNTGAACT